MAVDLIVPAAEDRLDTLACPVGLRGAIRPQPVLEDESRRQRRDGAITELALQQGLLCRLESALVAAVLLRGARRLCHLSRLFDQAGDCAHRLAGDLQWNQPGAERPCGVVMQEDLLAGQETCVQQRIEGPR